MQIGLVTISKGIVKGTNTDTTSQSAENIENVVIKDTVYTFDALLSSNLYKYDSNSPGNAIHVIKSHEQLWFGV